MINAQLLGLVASTLLLMWVMDVYMVLPVLLAVGLLWLWRWYSDQQRANAIAAVMEDKNATPLETAVVDALLEPLTPQCRDWLFRGLNTNAGTLLPRHVWQQNSDGGQFLTFDLHVLPGFMPMAFFDFIPVVRLKHSALLIQHHTALPACRFWRMDWRDKLDVKMGFLPVLLSNNIRHSVYKDFVICTADLTATQLLLDKVMNMLGQPQEAIFAATHNQWLLVIFKKHRLTVEQLQALPYQRV